MGRSTGSYFSAAIPHRVQVVYTCFQAQIKLGMSVEDWVTCRQFCKVENALVGLFLTYSDDLYSTLGGLKGGME